MKTTIEIEISEEPIKLRDQELFDYLYKVHGLKLLGNELYEIELIVARMLAKDREDEAADAAQTP